MNKEISVEGRSLRNMIETEEDSLETMGSLSFYIFK